MTLKRGSRRVAALAVVLKIGRPSASVPTGLIGLMFVTTGRSEPLAYMKPTETDVSRANARSIWTLFCQVWATTNAESTSHGDCAASVPVVTPLGNAGAPADEPLNE